MEGNGLVPLCMQVETMLLDPVNNSLLMKRPQLKLESHNSEIVFMANASITLQ